MKILVIGSGGREHAIVRKLKQSPEVTEIFCAPGNAGIDSIAVHVDIKADDIHSLFKFAVETGIEFTVVGPEVPLALGIVDLFNENGLKIFGPSASAARLENSKIFAKEFMKRHNIPTAGFEVFSSKDHEKAIEYLKKSAYPIVIKADGLAAGKGVVIAENENDSLSAIGDFFEKKIFGTAGEKVVIEDYITGTEASIFAICDGENYVLLPSSQDHKKIGEGETGKNTGGMGSYAPAEKTVTPEILEKVRKRIIEPVLKKMKSEENEFRGCLYCGIMIDKNKEPYVIEFNTRFGDPETQAVLPLVKSDFLELLLSSAEGRIGEYGLENSNEHCASIVLASKGYPDKYETGKEITGLESITNDCVVFHAGTKAENGKIISAGGRVLNVTGKSSKDLKTAIDIAYNNAGIINFENKYYRKDIGQKGL